MDTYTLDHLAQENARYHDTVGVSAEGRTLGFRPAFLDRATQIVYSSRYADGRLAPFHVLDGLPGPLVVTRNRHGCAMGVKASVVAGFTRAGKFYTRAQAAQAAIAQEPCDATPGSSC